MSKLYKLKKESLKDLDHKVDIMMFLYVAFNWLLIVHTLPLPNTLSY